VVDDGNTRDEFAPEDDMSIDEMPDVQDDETLNDVVAALSELPVVSEADVQRIVSRARAGAAETERRSGPRWAATRASREYRVPAEAAMRKARSRWFGAVPMAAAATLVLAAGVAGFLIGNGGSGDAAGDAARVVAAVDAPARVPGGFELTAVAADPLAEAPIGTQFVLDAPQAKRVTVVGAFNQWDAGATPLMRDPATGLWTINVPLAPGRHVYAYMVDDSVLTLDPRAPKAEDPELGASGSVILVGTP